MQARRPALLFRESENIIALPFGLPRFPGDSIVVSSDSRVEGDVLAARYFVHCGDAVRVGVELALPEEFSGLLIVSVDHAIGGGREEDQASRGHDRTVAGGPIASGIGDPF